MLRIFDDIGDREAGAAVPAGRLARSSGRRMFGRSNLRVFGRDLTPSEAVDEIVAAVRTDGDAGLRRFERELGSNARESVLVQPEEFEEADRIVLAGGTQSTLELAVYSGVRRFHERHSPEEAGWISTRQGHWDRSSDPWSG